MKFNSEVCEMSLNQYGWSRRKKCKNSYFLAQTTLALSTMLNEKVFLGEIKIKLANTSLQKKSLKLMRFKGCFHESVINFYQRLSNCTYLQSAKPVAFIYKNIFQGNNFPTQYHALNTVLRSLHSYAKISNIFCKINYNGQNFQAFASILNDGQGLQVFN